MQPSKRNRGRPRGGRTALAVLSIMAVAVLPAAGCGSESTPSEPESQQDVTTPATNLLPEDVLVALDVVQSYFPEIDHQTTTSENPTASGNPDATRMVIYEGEDGKRITVSVDRYPGPDSASAAFEQAIDASEVVPGFAPLPAPADVGDKAFAGVVTQGEDTHIGFGSLAGGQVVGVTAAGYPAAPQNIGRLTELMRAAVEKATTA
ncbi:hypothetical protein ACFTWF_43605 [Rhodococcus sp. NPDC056960]|uniref:hypothetical protein n=1 Tax=Rhodococcus sp. NPDC056960 TaxID=3345982 RepID=UPI0036425F50